MLFIVMNNSQVFEKKSWIRVSKILFIVEVTNEVKKVPSTYQISPLLDGLLHTEVPKHEELPTAKFISPQPMLV